MLKRGNDLPKKDHILRHIPINRTFRDDDGVVRSVSTSAFNLRDGESGLSVSWLEYFELDFNLSYVSSVQHLRNHRDIKPKDIFSHFNVDEFISLCSEFGINVRVRFMPTKILNHSEINNFSHENSILLEKLASIAFERLVKNSDIP